MKKILAIIAAVVFCVSTMTLAQESSKAHKRLEFLVGEWKSISVNQNTGEESTGHSSIQWILGGTWLQWKFTAQMENGLLEVLTLINYQSKKEKYAFYSFNSIDGELRPHYGNWLDTNTLRLEITSQDEKTCVDFKIKENGDFDQIHARRTSSGELIGTTKTSYSRIK